MVNWQEYKGIVELDYNWAVVETKRYMKVVGGFSKEEEKRFTDSFLASLEVDGIYDAVEMRENMRNFCNDYYDNKDLSKSNHSFNRIGTKELSKLEILANYQKSANHLFNDNRKDFFLEYLGPKYEEILDRIIDTPYTRNIFDGLNNKEVIQTIKKLDDNLLPLDQEIVFKVQGVDLHLNPRRMKWTLDKMYEIVNIINDYANEKGDIRNFTEISKNTRAIYGQFRKVPELKELLSKALRGKLFNQ